MRCIHNQPPSIPTPMATLQELLKSHLETRNISVKTLAERVGISYPTVLALINKGSIPRSQDHRDALREELGLTTDAWAAVFSASMRDGVEIPADGPLTLQQLVTKAMLMQGYSEQSLADKSGLPYPTLLGVTRKGAIPRSDALARIAESLSIDEELMEAAVALSKERRGQSESTIFSQPVGTTDDAADDAHDDDEAQPTDVVEMSSLAQLALDAITKSGVSTAHFAKQFDIPYLSLMRLIREGVAPVRSSALEQLRQALELEQAAFEAVLEHSRAHPEPASRAKASEIASNPLQASLLRLVDDRNLTIKSFAELADLSVLTATRLLRKGDLPGRQATHGKLRGLLGLAEAEYDLLLQRARAVGAGEATEDDQEAQPSALMQPQTEPYLRPSPVVLSFNANQFQPTQAASVPIGEPTDADFMALIARLAPKQRRTLMGILTSMV